MAQHRSREPLVVSFICGMISSKFGIFIVYTRKHFGVSGVLVLWARLIHEKDITVEKLTVIFE